MLREGYEYTVDDYYCYPGTCVLKNKLNIMDAQALNEAERKITSLRIAQALQDGVLGDFDFNHLKKIHFFLFSDIYEWAGKSRVVNISKEDMFCNCIYIADQMEILFNQLKSENFLKNCQTQKEVADRLAYYMGEINAIHPFREGNGRTERLFIQFLAESLGYDILFQRVNPDDMLKACIDSFNGDYDRLEKLMFCCLQRSTDSSLVSATFNNRHQNG